MTASSASDCAYLSLQPSDALGLEMFRPPIAKTDKFCLQIFFKSRSRGLFTTVISQLEDGKLAFIFPTVLLDKISFDPVI